MRAKGYKCSNVKCGSCVSHSLCGEPADTALGCVNRMVSTTTNADRIRAMSDEELADYLSKTFCHGYGKSQLVEWLKQPAEGE